MSDEVARKTVKRILQDHGIDPAPERSQRTPWRTFLLAHFGEGHLRLLTREYVEHYHRERNHQGLDNRLLQQAPRRRARPPTCSGATAWAASSISTIETPRDWSAH